jgi:hypothetical protein
VHNRRTEGAAKRALGRDRVRCRDAIAIERAVADAARVVPYSQCQTAQFSSFPRRVSAPEFLLSFSRPTPTRGGRSAGRRTGSPVALARRDTALARRGPSRATGTAPLSAPPWRFSAEGPRVMCPTVPPDHAATSRAPAARPKAFGSRSLPAAVAPQSRDATPRSACKTSPETPLMSEDGSESSMYSICSQYRSRNVVEMRSISGA